MEGLLSRVLRKFRHMKFMAHCKLILYKINGLEKVMSQLSDDELQAKTAEFKKRINENNETLNQILPEAFALVREASKRIFDKRLFDVQIIGGIVIHYGHIAEMRTGEGKTLCAIAPAYLNSLSNKQVHIITVNDYLAERDCNEMKPLYEFLGVTVGSIHQNTFLKESLYQSDVIYATNSEIAFDYLRDNMKKDSNFLIKDFYFAIIDEVDSILIDEARTPLIISGESRKASKSFYEIDKIVKTLTQDDYITEEKFKNAYLTENGIEKIETILKDKKMIGENLFSENSGLVHYISQSLKANVMMHKDIDYIVHDKQVMIIDESTGRIMNGRRYSDGLHQAIEAKEKVKIEPENRTVASITYQNFFRLYEKLSGMTGTAETEIEEFMEIYNLDVYAIPTNLPITRIDDTDRIYSNIEYKAQALLEMVRERHEKGQPILIGTSSVEKSEYFSNMLLQHGIKHNTLNARNHSNEAEIISQAGQSYAITIATNMAGRGTDIKLGGEDADDKKKVIQSGGLCVIGTERHESRRIDNQLQGRSGRQGDPGYSIFLISIDDSLFRIFGQPNISLGNDPSKIVKSKLVSKLIESAQQKVERMHFESRKNVLKYDDILNVQRKIIYSDRRDILNTIFDINKIMNISTEFIDNLFDKYMGHYIQNWNLEKLSNELKNLYNIDFKYDSSKKFAVIRNEILSLANERLNNATDILSTDDKCNEIIRDTTLSYVDQLWTDHINILDKIREGVHLQAYGQKDPFHEYQDAAYNMFLEMRDKIHNKIISYYIEHADNYKKNLQSVESLLDQHGTKCVIAIINHMMTDINDNRDIKLINIINDIKQQIEISYSEYYIEHCIDNFIVNMQHEDSILLKKYFEMIYANHTDHNNDILSYFSTCRINQYIFDSILNSIIQEMKNHFSQYKTIMTQTLIKLIKIRKGSTARIQSRHILANQIIPIHKINEYSHRNAQCTDCASDKRYKDCCGYIKSDCLFNINI